MATGMQTGVGRRTGASALRTGAAPAKAGGINGIMQKWTDLDSKTKTIVIIGAVVLFTVLIGFQMHSAANRAVPLYSSNITQADANRIQIVLSQLNIPHEVVEGGTNVLVPPQYKRRAINLLAAQGLPSRPVVTNAAGKADGGLAPPTREEKDREALLKLTGDLVETIREVEGVADARIQIVPKPRNDWGGDDKTTATAAIQLRMIPGTVLQQSQIKGIVHIVAFSVDGLEPENIKVTDTTGKILNESLDSDGMNLAEGDGRFTTKELEERKAIEDRLQKRVASSLSKILGGNDRFAVQVNVDLDFAQRETQSTKFGGPANVEGRVVTGEQYEKETYKSDPKDGESGGAIQTISDGGSSDNYIKVKKITRVKVDEITQRTVDVTPTIRRITCSVAVDNIKDPNMIAQIKSLTESAIGYDPTRDDRVEVASIPFIRSDTYATSSGFDSGMSANPPVGSGQNAEMPSWFYMALGIPVVLIILMVALFYVKQKSVQKEKQRLVLTSGPGTTVSDISDLLADKEGKVTPPAATKVNTTDQLEKLAKEKPTKVAELLKSTWMADQ